ncbi:uncharacterized protein LOC123674057 [Harmonia axyridis]|uniref:uncharacterized protein LOC123674057 n=1 Tax=Harmonia axyridis TaxID=115357 RepID=UPI001E2774B5|nr:uncharacterized protein LOC123674057 [Harmonia axyridis]
MPFIQWKGPFASTGFNDWKNPIIIEQHENSQNHKNCVLILLQRQKAADQVDALHVKEYKREVQYWREVLKRVVAAIKALASRGLSFRGSTEVFGSLHNGNYMMLLEFLAEFDPFLADHIEKHGNQGRGNVSYLSSSICEEIIQIMATEVLKSIDQEVTEAKYYSISVDSTPDITHTDQLAFITRYNKEDGKPVERFLGFIPNPGHKAEDLYNAVIKMMEEHNFNFANCRGQSYDNAANMSGIYNGLQAKIKEISPLAYWIPCTAHSLNLVGEHAAGSLKRLSTTRWSARYEACNSMNQNWKEVVAALSEIDERDRSKTGSGAKGLKIKLTSLETAIMFAVWSPILERFDKVSEAIQKVGIGIDEVVLNYESLVDYILGLRDQFDRFEKKRRSVLDLRNIEVKKEEPQQELFLLMKLDSEELGVAVTNLISSFPQDLDEKLHDECLHFKSYLGQLEQPPKTLHEMSTFIRSDKSLVQVFPYIDITIRMFLCTFATNCSAERSFSALKRILSYLRSSMSQERLNSLAVLCIEAELLKKLDFEAVLQQFAEKKICKRVPVTTKIRQGYSLSPILFSIKIDETMKDVKQTGRGCRMRSENIKKVYYADNSVIMSEDKDNLQRLPLCVPMNSQHLQISEKKTNILRYLEMRGAVK